MGDDDVKEEDAVKMPSSYRSPRKRARPAREQDDENKPFIDHLTKQPLKKRKLNYCNAGTPMPMHLGKVTFKRRRRLFTPAKTPVRRVRKNKNVRIKVNKQWFDGVVQDVIDDEKTVVIRYKVGKDPHNEKKFIMKEKKLPIHSKLFEMMNNRNSRLTMKSSKRLSFD